MLGALARYEHKAALAVKHHATAVHTRDVLRAKLKATKSELAELNHPSCSLSTAERSQRIVAMTNSLPVLETELRLAEQSAEQSEVKITETRSQLHNSRLVARQLSDRIAHAEQGLRDLVNSELPPPSITLFRVRVERDLAALRAQYADLVGEDEVPLEAA